jgi:hypothetical protein
MRRGVFTSLASLLLTLVLLAIGLVRGRRAARGA